MIRFFDILFSFLGILFLSPVFLFLYIAIRLESKGGGFYSLSKSPEDAEQRAGRGQLFQYGGLYLHCRPASCLHY